MAAVCSKQFTIQVGELGLGPLSLKGFCKGSEIVSGEAFANLILGPNAVAPFTWTVESGEAALNAAGITIAVGIEFAPGEEYFELTGTPTVTGPISFTVKVVDEQAPTPNEAVAVYTIHVGEIVNAAGALAPAALGQAYSETLTQNGVPTPGQWSITEGLAAFTAAGLSLNPQTGEISGTPVSAGTVTFTATISSANV